MSIYFLRHSGLIKIGYSGDLVARVGSLVAAIPGEVLFLGHMPGGRDLEAHLHRQFADLCRQGEWFEATQELETWVARAADPVLPELPNTFHSVVRKERDGQWEEFSARVRKAAAYRWPELNHKQRKSELAGLLGMTSRRARSLYDCQPGCNLRASEAVAAEERLLKILDRTSPKTGGGE